MPRKLKRIRIEQTSCDQSKLLLFVGGKLVAIPQAPLVVLECLYQNQGCLVPYEQLGLRLGYESTQRPQRHRIRQYVTVVKRLLVKNDARYVVTVAEGAGYALCEIAVPPP